MVRITSCSSKEKKCHAEQRDKTQRRETDSIQKRRLPTTVCLGYTTMTANRNKYQNNSKEQTRRRKKRQIFHRHLEETEHAIYKQEQLYIYIYIYIYICITVTAYSLYFGLFSSGGSEFVLDWCDSGQYDSANVI
jgi:hypothetical protein